MIAGMHVGALCLVGWVATAGAQSNVLEVPLYHSSIDGINVDAVYVEVDVGTPPSRAAVLFDTGSATFAVPSSNVPLQQTCNEYFGPGKAQLPICPSSVTAEFLLTEGNLDTGTCVLGSYDYEVSSTAQILPSSPESGNTLTQPPYNCETPGTIGNGSNARSVCLAGAAYGGNPSPACGQGFTGILGSDLLTLGSGNDSKTTRVSMVFVTDIQQGLQEPPAAGIMGVGLSSLNDLSATGRAGSGNTMQPNAITLMLNEHTMNNEFSICLGNATTKGSVVFGGIKEEYLIGSFRNVPMVTDAGYYGIEILSVGVVGQRQLSQMPSIAQQTAIFQNSNSICDTGTPQLLLPSDIYNGLMNSNIPCNNDSQCILDITVQGLSESVTLEVPGVMTCSTEFQQCNPNPLIVRDGHSQAILGYAVLKNFYTIFRRGGAIPTFGFGVPSSKCGSSSNFQIPVSDYEPSNSAKKGFMSTTAGWIIIIVIIIVATTGVVVTVYQCSKVFNQHSHSPQYEVQNNKLLSGSATHNDAFVGSDSYAAAAP